MNKKQKTSQVAEKDGKQERKAKSYNTKGNVAEVPEVKKEEQTKDVNLNPSETKSKQVANVQKKTVEQQHKIVTVNKAASQQSETKNADNNTVQNSWVASDYAQPNSQNVEGTEVVDSIQENTAARGGGSGGVALLLLIILCLFPLINLIPVFITDGGITLNFWVTLILNLTLIGAVIFSLLVVLGIVSLA
ncbi:hypothetical protein CW751_14165 [Brumimicrobium salinarum]|uniref:Uncharacterized protein n=1 Tax=Brumimicrobium salinarum TaxID=2058658 RepID=A0A2I0QZ79_9FLAO|nr:hypothetical protein CW751_14165 [Brumimicrobium salinarum]